MYNLKPLIVANMIEIRAVETFDYSFDVNNRFNNINWLLMNYEIEYKYNNKLFSF